jgi:hypothetical protein
MLAVLLVALLVPTLSTAAMHSFSAGKVSSGEANTVVVPLVISNEDNLCAMDIPLKFSEGVSLKEVTFEGTRTEYFDLKIANINNDDNSVIIGLLPQMTATAKPDLAAGTGPVANLVFEVVDESITEVTLETFETKSPGHFLCFVYHDYRDGVPHSRVERPEYEATTVSLTAGLSTNLPNEFALSQNYPNPFNPATTFSFDVPKAAHVTLAVYNVLGQEVARLLDTEREAGTYTVEFDGSSLASGVYFYRLSAGDFTDTKKMLLVK